MIKFASVGMLVAMVVVRTLALLALMKFLALRFGTEGFGQLSQILALGALFSVLAGGGLTNGIVRNLAAADTPQERAAWIRASLPIAAWSAVALGIVALVIYATAANTLFAGQDLAFALIVMAVSQAVVGFGNIALAYLSGTHDIKRFTLANSVGSIAAAVFVALLAEAWGFHGAVAGCAAMALMPALAALALSARAIDWALVRQTAFDRARAVALLKFGATMYLAVAAVPLVWIYIRSDLAIRKGWHDVGLWQSTMRISDAYMQVFGIIFMNYELPQLAASAPADRAKRLRHIALMVFGLFLSGTTLVYFGRQIVLRLAFSAQFEDAATYLAPQIFGDAFKLLSLLFVFYLMALNRVWVLAAMEVLQAGLILVAYWILVSHLGDRAAVMSYALATFVVSAATLLLVVRTRGLPARQGDNSYRLPSI
jgi:O-antigen/teichoic acid export membrane protein